MTKRKRKQPGPPMRSRVIRMPEELFERLGRVAELIRAHREQSPEDPWMGGGQPAASLAARHAMEIGLTVIEKRAHRKLGIPWRSRRPGCASRAVAAPHTSPADRLREEARRRLAERAAQRAAAQPVAPAPRYDEVFAEGVAALDALAGPELPPGPTSPAVAARVRAEAVAAPTAEEVREEVEAAQRELTEARREMKEVAALRARLGRTGLVEEPAVGPAVDAELVSFAPPNLEGISLASIPPVSEPDGEDE